MTSQVNSALKPCTYIDFNQVYTSYGFKQIIQRHCEYVRERPYGALNGRILPMALIAAGGVVGFAAGTQVAKTFEIEKKEKIALQGSCTILGGVAGASIYISIAETNLFFKTWKLLKLTVVLNR